MGNISREIKSSEIISEFVNDSLNEAENISILQKKISEDVDEIEDDEYDFDKEFSDDEYGDENNIDSFDYNSVDEKKSTKVITNIEEIMAVRVNNTLAKADKKILNQEIEKMQLLKDFTFDQEIGYLVCNLLDAKIRAASNDCIILSYEYDSIVGQNLMELEKITYVYNKITGSEKKIAIISDNIWEEEKNKYIKNIKEGVMYNVIEEPQESYEETLKNDIILNSAVELFGDIVEIS